MVATKLKITRLQEEETTNGFYSRGGVGYWKTAKKFAVNSKICIFKILQNVDTTTNTTQLNKRGNEKFIYFCTSSKTIIFKKFDICPKDLHFSSIYLSLVIFLDYICTGSAIQIDRLL